MAKRKRGWDDETPTERRERLEDLRGEVDAMVEGAAPRGKKFTESPDQILDERDHLRSVVLGIIDDFDDLEVRLQMMRLAANLAVPGEDSAVTLARAEAFAVWVAGEHISSFRWVQGGVKRGGEDV